MGNSLRVRAALLRLVLIVLSLSAMFLAIVSFPGRLFFVSQSDQQTVRASGIVVPVDSQEPGSGDLTAPNPVPTGQASLTPSDTPLPSFTSTPTGSVTGTVTPTPCSSNFEDVPPTHPDYDAIRFLICDGAMESFQCGQPGEPCVPPNNYPYFRPNNLPARGEVAKYLTLAQGFPINTTGGPHFADVPVPNPFYPYVETLYNRGIVTGYSDGTFRPGNPVTRAQLAKVIVLSEGWVINTTGGPHFTDVPVGSPFYPYIETVYNRDVMEGYCDGTFLPDSAISRAEFARYIFRAITGPLNLRSASSVHTGPAVSTCAPVLTATPTTTPATPTPTMPTTTTATATATLTTTATATPAPLTATSTSTSIPASLTPTVLVTNTATGTTTPQCQINFTDVAPSDYFYEAVQYLYCHNAISGYSDGTFRPYNNTTRGQLSKIVVLAEQFPVDTTGGPHFTDVPTSNPFYVFIETAYNRGLISGYSDNTFRWGNNITRGQLTKIVVLAEGWPIDMTGGPHFVDVPTSDPFYTFVETAYHRGVISGYSDGTFRPGSSATRGQIAKIVYQALHHTSTYLQDGLATFSA